MKSIYLIAANLVSISMGIAAAFLCFNGKEGWGYFLLVSAISMIVPKSD